MEVMNSRVHKLSAAPVWMRSHQIHNRAPSQTADAQKGAVFVRYVYRRAGGPLQPPILLPGMVPSEEGAVGEERGSVHTDLPADIDFIANIYDKLSGGTISHADLRDAAAWRRKRVSLRDPVLASSYIPPPPPPSPRDIATEASPRIRHAPFHVPRGKTRKTVAALRAQRQSCGSEPDRKFTAGPRVPSSGKLVSERFAKKHKVVQAQLTKNGLRETGTLIHSKEEKEPIGRDVSRFRLAVNHKEKSPEEERFAEYDGPLRGAAGDEIHSNPKPALTDLENGLNLLDAGANITDQTRVFSNPRKRNKAMDIHVEMIGAVNYSEASSKGKAIAEVSTNSAKKSFALKAFVWRKGYKEEEAVQKAPYEFEEICKERVSQAPFICRKKAADEASFSGDSAVETNGSCDGDRAQVFRKMCRRLLRSITHRA